MRQFTLFAVWVTAVLLLIGCASAAGADAPPGDKASLIAALEAAGATVEEGEAVMQPIFSVEGQILVVNGADVQVYEYQTGADMEEEAAQVSPDGSSTETTMITWIEPPHFYKSGKILALYVGSDEQIIGLLEQVLGPQFAGQ